MNSEERSRENMYQSLDEITAACSTEEKASWQVVQEDDCREEGIGREESEKRMAEIFAAMKASDEDYDPSLKSASGLVGTDAERLHDRKERGGLLCGPFCASVMERALRVAESNACMKRIVAAPTAGSCGVVPAVLLSMQEKKHFTDEQMIQALYTAGGFGGVIAHRASLSGAAGGCQAEIGAASAMAAGAAVSLLGGTPDQMCHAAAMALSALMGLVCDPVAGLVEVPCVKRNVIGAMNAVSCADMAMAGITSRIPPDEVIDAMKAVGHAMSPDLRETGRGGLAGTPTGQRIRDRIGHPAGAV